MARCEFFLICALTLLAYSTASAAVIEHSFYVRNLTIRRLCSEQVITTVNGKFPGPTIRVREGDTLVVHVCNKSPHNITIHWHGVIQKLTAWADGADFATQCPIQPGNLFTYRFNITGQEGTLWWHAHVKWLRATVHGALVIQPRAGQSYPFPEPSGEFRIILGEMWKSNIVDVLNEGLASGADPNISDAYTINGRPGDLYPCPLTYKMKVLPGKTYLLRIINAAINTLQFFKIAQHKMTVVAIDAAYTEPYVTNVVMIAPGQTTDVLLTTDQPLGSYYIAARPYYTNTEEAYSNTTTTGLLVYHRTTSKTPRMPILPPFDDTPTAHKFSSSLVGLVKSPHWVPVPQNVDEHMFVTLGMGVVPCEEKPMGMGMCKGDMGERMAASMNNESFQAPTTLSMLQAHYYDVKGIYSNDFPNMPMMEFDYTNPNTTMDDMMMMYTMKSTKVKKLKYNATVEIVFQNTALMGLENHPMHIHGHNFHVLAQGFGNYDMNRDGMKYNLVNPQVRNTVGVPAGGWAVVRFRADNPGVWFIHCHVDRDFTYGMATAFVVENGPTPDFTLPPPPWDLPQC